MSDKGITDLEKLLANLQPGLDPDAWVFCVLDAELSTVFPALEPFAIVREAEGLTLVIRQREAERHQIQFDGIYRKIELGVHSSLQAVGLTAAVSTALTECGISANVIAGFYHDHVFVPAGRAEEALEAIGSLS